MTEHSAAPQPPKQGFTLHDCACGMIHFECEVVGFRHFQVTGTGQQVAKFAELLGACAQHALEGGQFICSPPMTSGLIVLRHGRDGQIHSLFGGGDFVEIGLASSPAQALDIVRDAAALAREWMRRSERQLDAADDRFRHLAMERDVAEIARTLPHDGLLSVGCSCGQVHVFPITHRSITCNFCMSPTQIDGLARDLQESAKEATRLAATAPKTN